MDNVYTNIIKRLCEKKNQYVIAPAGCGKTQMITDFSNKYQGKILILTHTNAAIDVINGRISNGSTKIKTIASFMEKYVKSFDGLSDINIDYSCKNKYKKVYEIFSQILQYEIIKKILIYNYDMIFVDEYQDCTISQHKSICLLSKILPVKIFGDYMQAIYNFDKEDHLVDFNTLKNSFEYLGELNYPWRWKNNISLGNWLMSIRNDYENSFINIFNKCLDRSIKIIGENDIGVCFELLKNNEKNCIITKRKASSIKIAQRLRGSYTVLEELEMNDLSKVINNLIENNYISFTLNLLILLKNCYAKSNAILNKYIEKLQQNSIDFRRLKSDEKLKSYIFDLTKNYNYGAIKYIIDYVDKHKDTNCYRKELMANLNLLIKKINCSTSIIDGINVFRQTIKRKNYNNVVAHTLLIKGLEFDNCIIYKKELTTEELYVALTRAKNKIYIVL